MKKILIATLAMTMGAAAANGAGIERSSQSVGILFEEGRYAELSFGVVSPSVSGSVGGGAILSGDMMRTYPSLGLGYKMDLGENMDFAFIVDQPVGANVAYPVGTGYPLQGTTAEIHSIAYTALLRYRFPSNMSVYGGVRLQQAGGRASLPFLGGYTLETGQQTDVGYVLGVAYEKPEIALRVALTYNSAITHRFDNVLEFGAPSTPFETTIPQSLNLEFQSGVAPDTLVFGSIRWVDWSEYDISPAQYVGLVGSPLSSYSDDGITYNIGVGRRFSDAFSGALSIGYEKASNVLTGNLGPVDGNVSLGLAAIYKRDNMKITLGVRYVWLGDATTTIGADFTDNHALGAGVKIGYSF